MSFASPSSPAASTTTTIGTAFEGGGGVEGGGVGRDLADGESFREAVEVGGEGAPPQLLVDLVERRRVALMVGVEILRRSRRCLSSRGRADGRKCV